MELVFVETKEGDIVQLRNPYPNLAVSANAISYVAELNSLLFLPFTAQPVLHVTRVQVVEEQELGPPLLQNNRKNPL